MKTWRTLVLATLCALAAPLARAGTLTPLPTTAPKDVGLSAERLGRMGAFFAHEAEVGYTPGYVLMVARHGKLAYSTAVGLRDREQKLPMTPDTRFRIASMTKPVTAVAVMMLYEEGRFELDDPVAKFLPEFAHSVVYTGIDEQGAVKTEPAKRPITIRQLLTNTSGLGYAIGADFNTPLGKAWASVDVWSPGSLADKVAMMAALPLYSQPGDTWRYSYSADVLGRLVEAVSGMSFQAFLKTRLFDPLGMTHTGFTIAANDVSMMSKVYNAGPKGEVVPSDLPFLAVPPTDPARWPSGGGGLISTAGDYLRFAQMLANSGQLNGRRYLSPVTVSLMTSNQVPPDTMAKSYGPEWRGLGYGLLISMSIDATRAVHADVVGDYTWPGMLDTQWLVSPKTGLVAVLMTQVDPRAGVRQRTYNDFRNLLYAAVEQMDGPAASAGR